MVFGKKCKTIIINVLCATLAAFMLASCVSCGNTPAQGQDSTTPEPADSSTTPPPADTAADTTAETTAELTDVADLYADFLPIIRFVACSDIHMTGESTVQAKRFEKLFDSAYAYSESQEYKKLDAILVAGDLTNKGQADELTAFKSVVNKKIKPETQLITVMGNHEYMNAGPDVYKKTLDNEANKHVVINGFHFIGISPSEKGQTYDASIDWLKTELAAAAQDDPARPIFSFRHHHLQNTVYVSKSWYTDTSAKLKQTMGEYPQIIDFSGDSHGPMNNPLSIMQDKFTMLGTGTLSYFEMEEGMTGGTLPEGKENAAQYYIVEVDKDYRVRIQPYNILTDDFFRTPSNTDDPGKQLVYYIDKPSDPSTFNYTKARGTDATAPRFADGAELKVEGLSYTKATVVIPQALDDSCIYSYTLKVTSGGKVFGTYKFFSEYYFEPMPATVSYFLSGLKAGTEYEATVTPVNAWDKKGTPIKITFKTPDPTNITYETANDVTYKWTFTDFENVSKLSVSAGTPAYGGNATGDVFAGEWNNNTSKTDCIPKIVEGKGFNGSKALAVTKTGSKENRCWYLFANDTNKFVKAYAEPKYLRVWVDFTGVDFRKACFGVVDETGALYSTDDLDKRSDLPFYYLAEGSSEWKTYYHGTDGCFGADQSSSVKNFKGWLAFPTANFGPRDGKGGVFGGYEISAVYMYWDFKDKSMCGTEFYVDEISLVSDYKVFEEWTKQ